MALALCLAGQHLELDRQVVQPEQDVEVRAVDSTGGSIPGLPVDLVGPDGGRRDLGVTDAEGILRFRLTDAGYHELRAELGAGGPLLITPFQVADQPPRWPFALACVPLGLALLFMNLRQLRRSRILSRSGPSPRAP